MSKPIRVIQYGLGAIGRATARLVLQKQSLQLVGAVDAAPHLVGRDLGEVLGCERPLGLAVTDRPEPLLSKSVADAVLHCTGSSFVQESALFRAIAKAGLHCVSSCEEALYPAWRHPALAARLDALCRQHRVGLLGTGVNPGFVMDTLAVLATAVCQEVKSVRVRRVVDAATRREALQRKVGAGLTEAEFGQLAQQQKIRHVGLAESLVFVADALGWNLESVDESIAPVISPKTIQTDCLRVTAGQVAGVRQLARGLWQGREVLTLDLQMYVGAPEPRDEIQIDGTPPMHVVIAGGTAGDLATPAILVNCLPRLLEAPPGLQTMKSIGLPRVIG